jgi:hypothetical protein
MRYLHCCARFYFCPRVFLGTEITQPDARSRRRTELENSVKHR